MSRQPPRVSALLAVLLAAVGIALVATMPDMVVPVALIAVAAVLLAGGILVAAGRSAFRAALTSLLFVLAAGVTAAAVAAATLPHAGSPTEPIDPRDVNRMLLAALAVVAVGVAATGALTVPRSRSFARGGRSLLRTATASCVAVVVALLIVRNDTPGGALEEAVGVLPRPLDLLNPSASPTLGGFLLVGGVATLAVAAATLRIPLAPLTPRAYRERIERTTVLLGGVLHRIGTAAVAIGVCSWVATIALGVVVLDALPAGVSGLVGGPATSGFLRRALVEIAVVAGALAIGFEWIHRRETDGTDDLLELLAGAVGGAVLAGSLVASSGAIFDQIGSSLPRKQVLAVRLAVSNLGAETLLLLGALAVCGGLALLLALLGALAKLGALSPTDASAVLAAAGLTIAAVVAGHLHEPTTRLFLAVALAVVLWDVASFGQGLVAEVGRDPPTSRTEFVHAGGVLTVGVVAAFGIDWARTATVSSASPVAGLLAIAAVFVVAMGLAR